jgi:hypothetical protein
VPKGLRSFDGEDADFFLELLPGPRDRDGLPESLRFWKRRLEETDPDNTFSVGVIYGPSGCGKSSLVKAGLLPRLAEQVSAVYVEATAEETEARLLKGLRKRCPELPTHLGLVESVAALRRGQGLAGRKVLLVLDQFEQWLHARRAEDKAELVPALRQCDGGSVQCLVLVRDDFWMAVTRFMQEVEVELAPGRNLAAVDLFDLRHARTVLAAFGRAFGALPAGPGELTREQEAFLDQALGGLAQDGKLVCVRLALFAEMVKGKPWTPATLKAVGGAEGVGVAFLEETFSAQAASPRHRLHQKAARSLLKSLLPESGTDIRGNMRSRQELLEASGYADRPRDFEGLLRTLDGELRLVTPTDPEGVEGGSGLPEGAATRSFFQLTHDYLVPAVRDWLTRKQKETRRGRAELRLAERAALWQNKPENRHLPAWWEWLTIRLLTRTKDWTPPQRKMMRQAARYHGVRGLALLIVLLLCCWGGYEVYGRMRADSLVGNIVTADTEDVQPLLKQAADYRRWARPLLLRHIQQGPEDSKAHLHASLALLPVDEEQAEYLYQRLLRASPAELPVIRDALLAQRPALRERLWGVLENRQAEANQRFRAACAVAGSEVTEDEVNRRRWEAVAPFVADRLLAAAQDNPSHCPPLIEALRPVRDRLVVPLAEVFRSTERPDPDRSWAAILVAQYAAPDLLADLLLDANARQFAVLWPKAEAQRQQVVAACDKTLGTALESQQTEAEKERLGKRQANAGVVLLRLGQVERVWQLLRRRPPDDPRARSYLIDRLSPLGADPLPLIRQLDAETDVSVRRALLLSLGESGPEQLPPARREELLPRVWQL